MAGRRAHQSTGPHIDDPASIVAIFPHDPQDFDLTLSQIQERVHLVKAWDIKAGERVLEIGCGQGECTATLAAAVGAQGLVTALDSASLDYGQCLLLPLLTNSNERAVLNYHMPGRLHSLGQRFGHGPVSALSLLMALGSASMIDAESVCADTYASVLES
ncbi:hypothetical protein B0H21DRAFT_559870 [Amylocystis lapponica]|nr:hypothetical protein B0H21DRAFT_559870 [Amylocystis lapponica]